MNTLSEIEEYYKAREQQLLKKLHQQEAALAAANQKLKQLTEDQKVSEDETARRVSHYWMWMISRSATILMGIMPGIWH